MGSPVVIRFREFDSNGDPLSGGKLYSYIAGTTTKRATFSDPECTIPNTNPVILDAAGYADVWVEEDTPYKFRLDDADDVTLYTKDNISGAAASSTSSGGGGEAWVEHAITDGQSATDLEGEEIDFDDYSSVFYDVEIRRGTTVAVNGPISIQHLNGTGRVVYGSLLTEELHGVTFSLNQVGTVAQLKAATSSGPGAGTIKLSRRLIPA